LLRNRTTCKAIHIRIWIWISRSQPIKIWTHNNIISWRENYPIKNLYRKRTRKIQFWRTIVYTNVTALNLILNEVRVAQLFSLLSCPIKCLFVVSSVLWCPLRFPHKNNVWLFYWTIKWSKNVKINYDLNKH
jgi:hypothetical protein